MAGALIVSQTNDAFTIVFPQLGEPLHSCGFAFTGAQRRLGFPSAFDAPPFAFDGSGHRYMAS